MTLEEIRKRTEEGKKRKASEEEKERARMFNNELERKRREEEHLYNTTQWYYKACADKIKGSADGGNHSVEYPCPGVDPRVIEKVAEMLKEFKPVVVMRSIKHTNFAERMAELTNNDEEWYVDEPFIKFSW